MKEYKFSVVIPIYNVEKYLEETIISIIKQNIDFKKNIQLILVNDGSKDNSEKICLKYKEKYPENVLYIKQENAGVCAARNEGVKYIQGKYVNFLDGDDKWESNVFEKAYKMFEEHSEIDVIGVRQRLFDAEEGYHLLDYKFTSDRIIDINEEYNCIQLNLSSGFFRAEALKNKRFDTRVKYAEDAKFLFDIILEKEKYGIISSSVHFYRKRFENDSAMQKAKEDISYYTDTLEYILKYIRDLSLKKYNRIIPYVQYYLMYELRWRIFSSITDKLKEKQKEDYINTIKEFLSYIDDKIIFELENTKREQRIYCASLKYGRDIREDFILEENNNIKFNDIVVAKIVNKDYFKICFIEEKENNLMIEGKIRNIYPEKDYKIYLKNNKEEKYNLEYYEIPSSEKYSFLGECYYKDIGFKVEVPAEKIKKYVAIIEYKNYTPRRLYLNFKNTSGISQDVEKMYVVKNKFILTTEGKKIYIEKNRKKIRYGKEWDYLKELFKIKKYKIIFYKIANKILKGFFKKPIWMIFNNDPENEEKLIGYIQKHEKEAKIYWVIDKNNKNKDERKSRKYCKTILNNSFKFKMYFLLSSKVIHLSDDKDEINLFGEDEVYLINLYKHEIITEIDL